MVCSSPLTSRRKLRSTIVLASSANHPCNSESLCTTGVMIEGIPRLRVSQRYPPGSLVSVNGKDDWTVAVSRGLRHHCERRFQARAIRVLESPVTLITYEIEAIWLDAP